MKKRMLLLGFFTLSILYCFSRADSMAYVFNARSISAPSSSFSTIAITGQGLNARDAAIIAAFMERMNNFSKEVSVYLNELDSYLKQMKENAASSEIRINALEGQLKTTSANLATLTANKNDFQIIVIWALVAWNIALTTGLLALSIRLPASQKS